MRRTRQECSGLGSWFQACGVELRAVVIQQTQHGSGVVTASVIHEADGPLIEVPSRIVLSVEYVWRCAEQDLHLRQCLEAAGEFAKIPRGAIMIFLLIQLSATSPDVSMRIGTENAWTTYVQFLPTEANLPTFWTEIERQYLECTSLEQALAAKLSSLQYEYENFQESVRDIEWCQTQWLDPNTGCLTFHDWKLVDSMWRSRTMEIPSYGPCMVPVADMVNHAHNDWINARTHVDQETGNVQLVLDGVRSVAAGTELNITYGQDKGACEMLFSYGFIDSRMTVARSISLDLADPDDDPIFLAKKHLFRCEPRVQIAYVSGDSEITWVGEYVWLMCINEEDGLDIAVVDDGNDGQRLKASWKGSEVDNMIQLRDSLAADKDYDLFRLRAYAIVNSRVATEIDRRAEHFESQNQQPWWSDRDESSQAWKDSQLLRGLEWQMLKAAKESFELAINWMYKSPVVQKYFTELGGDQNPT